MPPPPPLSLSPPPPPLATTSISTSGRRSLPLMSHSGGIANPFIFLFFSFSRICISPLGNERGPACARAPLDRPKNFNRTHGSSSLAHGVLKHSHRDRERVNRFSRFYARSVSTAAGRSRKHGEHGIFNNGQR